jgi:hypothetical protein
MIRTLRAYFLTRLLREKLLLLLLIVGATAWWLTSFAARAGAFWREQRSTGATLVEQQQWLDNRTRIETDAQKAASRLDAAQTLDRTRLMSVITQAATEAGLRANTSSSVAGSQTSGQFTVHSIDTQVSQADFVSLEQFYLNLQKRAPYLGIEQFTLQASAADPAKLTLRLLVSSVEIAR